MAVALMLAVFTVSVGIGSIKKGPEEGESCSGLGLHLFIQGGKTTKQRVTMVGQYSRALCALAHTPINIFSVGFESGRCLNGRPGNAVVSVGEL